MPYKILASLTLSITISIFSSCHGHMEIKEDLAGSQESVTKSVADFADTVAADVTSNSVSAWLKYFSQSPNFYMASEGLRVFPSYDTASQEIKNKLSKELKKIVLHWSEMHIDSLSPTMADFSSRYNEELTLAEGKTIATAGYATGTVEKTPSGWKFRNLHWSTTH